MSNKWGFEAPTPIGGDITFQKTNKNKKKDKYKKIRNVICYILIASLSGAVTSKILVKREIAKVLNSKESRLYLSNDELKEKKDTDNQIGRTIIPSVVSVESIITDENKEIESGAGTIISEDGYIVTNHHVINKAEELKVKLYNNKTYSAQVVGVDAVLDIALLKITAENLRPIKIGNSDEIQKGNTVIAVGSPISNSFSEEYNIGVIENTKERISVMDRQTNQPIGYNAIKTSIKIFPGNSGGPLCNEKGEMIGINNSALNYIEKGKKAGFAITIEDARPIISALMQKENILRLGLGIYGDKAVPKNDSEGVAGVYVKDVIQDSYAYKAGIRPTDIIVSIDNHPIKNVDDMYKVIKGFKKGVIVECKVWKNGHYQLINVQLDYYRMPT